ncbi:MAG TPA: MarR family winged helix-turn-helix transcriptional regulator [Candidatus Dormibacteraeota bacterium]|nr:MarR family winged helix-turn-helix transcriptional regulator [Candidatus Dormibacteraeota bacterium]
MTATRRHFRAGSLSALLGAAERALAAELDDGLRRAGYSDLRAAHAHVFAALQPQGSRLSALAARAGITKQAMGELVRHLQHHGYLEVGPDRHDRRAKIVRLTGEGAAAGQLSLALLEAGERRLVSLFGERGVEELRDRLRALAEGSPRAEHPLGRWDRAQTGG